MARKWSEVQGSPAFQGLAAAEQEAARQQYFAQIVAPQVEPAEVDAVRTQFDRQTRIAKADLPAGVAPSTAGAGRGSQGGMSLADVDVATQARRGGTRGSSARSDGARPYVAAEPAVPDMPTDDAIRDAADPFQRAKLLDQKAQATPRTTGDLVGDVGQAALRGAMRTAQLPSAVYGLATGNTDNQVNRFFDQGVEASRALRSDRSQADAAALEAKIGAAEGWREKLAVAMLETMQDPGSLLETSVESLPQMLGGAGIGRAVAQGVRAGAGALAVRALAGDSAGLAHAAVAASRAAQAAPVAGAVGAGAVSQGQDTAADTFREAMKMVVAGDDEFGVPPDPRYVALRQQGLSAADAHRQVAQQIAQKAGLLSAGISVGAQMLPGGRTIETAFLRKPAQQAARGGVLDAAGDRVVAGVKETVSEGFEEGGGPVARDVALGRNVNVGDAAAAFGQGAAAGGAMGTVAGRGLPTPDRPLRPTEQRKQAFDAFDDYVAEHAMPPNLVAAIKKNAEGVPLANLPGFIERAKESLAKRGLWRGPVDKGALDAGQSQHENAPAQAANGYPLRHDTAGLQTHAQAGKNERAPMGGAQDKGVLRGGLPAASDALNAADLIDDGSGLAEPSAVDIAAREAATSPHNDRSEPTEAQKAAGVYKMGHPRVGPLGVSIENDEGSTRRGVDDNGQPWETTMQGAHYGYIKATVAYDSTRKKKQGVDIFVKTGTPEDYSGPVFVVDQVNPKTGEFDEHKAVAGAKDEAEAEAIYRSNYAADWQGFGGITRLPMPAFDAWVHSKAPSKGPLGDINAANPDRDGRSQPADLGRGDGGQQLREQRPEGVVDDARRSDGQDLGRVEPAGLRPDTDDTDALKTPAAGPAATQETRNEAQSTQASPEAAEARQAPVLATPDVVWNGVGKKGMLEHAARQQLPDVTKRFPGHDWTVVKAPEFGPYAFKLEGRKQTTVESQPQAGKTVIRGAHNAEKSGSTPGPATIDSMAAEERAAGGDPAVWAGRAARTAGQDRKPPPELSALASRRWLTGWDAAPAAAKAEEPPARVFKTRDGASMARRKMGNTYKVQKVKGGFILREMTDKELAAARSLGKRAKNSPVDPTKDNLLTAIAKLGGLDRRSATQDAGVHKDYFKTRAKTIKPVFPLNGGMTAEAAVEALTELNYLEPGAGLHELEDKLGAELGGNEQFSMAHQYAQPDEPLAEFDTADLDASGYTAATPEVQALTEQLLIEAQTLGIDTETLREDAARHTEGQSDDQYHAAVQAAVRQALTQTRADAAQRDAAADQAGERDRGEVAQGEGEEGLTAGDEVRFEADFGRGTKTGVVARATGDGKFYVRSGPGAFIFNADELTRTGQDAVPLRGAGAAGLDDASRNFRDGSPEWYIARTLHGELTGGNIKITPEAQRLLQDADAAALWGIIKQVRERVGEQAHNSGDVRRALNALAAGDGELTTPTPESLQSAEDRAKAAAEAERAEQRALAGRDNAAKRAGEKAEKDARAAAILAEREAAKKAEVDAAVETFELGQEPPAPVERKVSTEQAAGQGDVFAQPAKAPRSADTQNTIALKKRVSVLESLRKCLAS